MLVELLLTFMSNLNPRKNLSNNFTKLYIYVQQLNCFTLNSTLSLLFFRKCAHMAIHVTFSMINSLVHSFCKCLCALWEILKQRKTQTKKYHDK